MWGCSNCIFGLNCSTSNQFEDEELCEDFVDFNDFYSDGWDSEEWKEFSYNRYTEGCLDTVEDEYSKFPW